MFEEQTLAMTEEERDQLLLDRVTFHYAKTRFNFLNEHSGLRRKNFHLLMGTAGTGKTTLSRSALMDLAEYHKIFVYSSEESVKETKAMFALRKTGNTILQNVVFWHERDAEKICGESADEWLKQLEIRIMNSKADIFFFDNLTTSRFYDVKVNDQPKIVSSLHSILHACNVAGFFVAHTANGVKDDQQALISTSDIRGNRSLTNKAEFVYAYQKFTSPPTGQSTSPVSYGTIRNLKARGHDVGSTFLLRFDFNTSEYTGDVKIPSTKFKEIYDSRFKLGK